MPVLHGRPLHLYVPAVVAALLLVVLAASVPGSRAAFSASVRNQTNTVASRDFFTCAAAITASAPNIYYKLNETGTTTVALDSTTNGFNGTYRGTVTKGVPQACVRDNGTAVTFNGSAGYVSLGTSLPVPTTYTTETWFKAPVPVGANPVIGGLLTGFGAAATGGSLVVDRVLYMNNAGRITFGVNVLRNTITSPLAYNDGTWHHAMATVGPAGMRLYIDGDQVATSATTANATFNGFFRVGYDSLLLWPGAPNGGFNGSLDEVAAYARTLTAAEAEDHADAGIP